MSTLETTPAQVADRQPHFESVAHGWRHQVRATGVVLRRELLRFGQDRFRMLTTLLQPLLFLFVMGTGLGSIVNTGQGTSFRTFLFPGVLATSVLFTAAFSGISLVWDREFGFLREMLVAPISRGSIIVGKCVGGAVVATGQSVILLALAGLVGVPYNLLMMLGLIGCLLLGSMLLTVLGVLLSSRIKSMQTAMPISQLMLTPMMFLSGSLFPINGLPSVLSIVTRLNPLTYVVQPMRHLVLSRLDLSPAQQASLVPHITWFGWTVPEAVQLLLVVVVIMALMTAAIASFRKTE